MYLSTNETNGNTLIVPRAIRATFGEVTMNYRAIKFAYAATAVLALVTSHAALGAPAPGGERRIKAEMYVEKLRSVHGVSADADVILRALERDPALALRLAKDPAAGEAMLRAAGATRAEHIFVTSGGDTGQRTITITIKIDGVTITITIRL